MLLTLRERVELLRLLLALGRRGRSAVCSGRRVRRLRLHPRRTVLRVDAMNGLVNATDDGVREGPGPGVSAAVETAEHVPALMAVGLKCADCRKWTNKQMC